MTEPGLAVEHGPQQLIGPERALEEDLHFASARDLYGETGRCLMTFGIDEPGPAQLRHRLPLDEGTNHGLGADEDGVGDPRGGRLGQCAQPGGALGRHKCDGYGRTVGSPRQEVAEAGCDCHAAS